MRSRTIELQENDIKTKEPKKSELKKNRERDEEMVNGDQETREG